MSPSVWGFVAACVAACLAVPSRAACPGGWTTQGFRCIGTFWEPMSWKNAEASCRAVTGEGGQAGHLLSLADVKETMLLSLMMDAARLDGMWIGLARQDNGDDTLTWSNGLPIGFLNLLDNELLDISGVGDCIQATLDGDQPALWSSSCETRLPYACELSDCPVGWTAHAGGCLGYFGEGDSWVGAQTSCQGYQVDGVRGHLVSVATDDENRFLTEWQKASSGQEQLSGTWVGHYGVPSSVRFLWAAERGLGSDSPGDPQRGARGGCTEMHRLGDGVWSQAADCDHTAPYICQLSGCPVGLVAFQGRCLLYLGEPDTETDEKPVGILSQIHAADSAKQPQRSSRNRRGAFNFGSFAQKFKLAKGSPKTSPAITRKFSFSNLWKKKTITKSSTTRTLGSTVNKSPFSGLNFRKSSQVSGSGGRVPFKFGAAFQRPGQSIAAKSNVPQAASRPPSPAQSVPAETTPAPARPVPAQSVPITPVTYCPWRWTKQGSSCYQFVDSEKAWNDAESYCNSADLGSYQAHLVTIENVLENRLLGLLVKSHAAGAHTWIGKKRVGGQNTWIVDEGSVFNVVPVQGDGSVDGCTDINQRAEWRDQDCSTKLRFFCEVKKTEKYKKPLVVAPNVQGSRIGQSSSSSSSSSPSAAAAAPPPRPAPKAAGPQTTKYCFPTWKELGDSCYHFSKIELTWAEARDKCRSYLFGNDATEQANVVSVTSAEEGEFLEAQTAGPVWIGRASDTSWLDGGPVGYRASEINAASPGTCSYALNKQWGYQECGHQLRYVCKMPKATVARVVRKKRSAQE